MNIDILREILTNATPEQNAEAIALAKQWVADAVAKTEQFIAEREEYRERTKNVSVGRYGAPPPRARPGILGSSQQQL